MTHIAAYVTLPKSFSKMQDSFTQKSFFLTVKKTVSSKSYTWGIITTTASS